MIGRKTTAVVLDTAAAAESAIGGVTSLANFSKHLSFSWINLLRTLIDSTYKYCTLYDVIWMLMLALHATTENGDSMDT